LIISVIKILINCHLNIEITKKVEIIGRCYR
jgi:hypothetical protein